MRCIPDGNTVVIMPSQHHNTMPSHAPTSDSSPGPWQFVWLDSHVGRKSLCPGADYLLCTCTLVLMIASPVYSDDSTSQLLSRCVECVLTIARSNNHVFDDVNMQAVETCNRDFPVRNYTVLVDGFSGPTILADLAVTMVMATVNSADVPSLVSGRMFQVGVMACSEVRCRNSRTIPLSKTRY